MEYERIVGDITMVGKIRDIMPVVYRAEITDGIESYYDGNVTFDEERRVTDYKFLPDYQISITFEVVINVDVWTGRGSGLWEGVHDLAKCSDSDFIKLFAIRDFYQDWVEEDPY